MNRPLDPTNTQSNEESEFNGNEIPSKPDDSSVPPPEPRQVPIISAPEPDEPEDPSEIPPPPAQN